MKSESGRAKNKGALALPPVPHDVLAQSAEVHRRLAQFQLSTGLCGTIVPVADKSLDSTSCRYRNRFCRLVNAWPEPPCEKTKHSLQRHMAHNHRPFWCRCWAGLTHAAVTIVVDGIHVATLDAGHILDRPPTIRDFRQVIQLLPRNTPAKARLALKKAYFATPVVPAERVAAAVQLLGMLAESLVPIARRLLAAHATKDPVPINRAIEYVQAHLAEDIYTSDLARHVHLSEQYFCKLFKRATGHTLVDYLSRLRVDKAEQLLQQQGQKIADIAHAVGFQSLAQFNRAFRRIVGKTPSEYRHLLR